MKKAKKNILISSLLVLLSFLSLIGAIPIKDNNNDKDKSPDDKNNIHLILDIDRYDKFPTHFRTTEDLSVLGDKNLNLKGLKDLNISGSEQFSKFNLPLLIKGIKSPYKIIDVDLRQESHGFLNGLPISWANNKDDVNKGLSLSQINHREDALLKSLKKNTEITFCNRPNITVKVEDTSTENQLVKANNLDYLRIPVTDYDLPTNETVDFFLSFVKEQPKDTWLHFHCKQGVGRTTTFMIMYDIIKNCNDVSLDDIILRQVNLPIDFKPETRDSFLRGRYYSFYQKFYKYCKENSKDNNPTWSSWIKLQEQ